MRSLAGFISLFLSIPFLNSLLNILSFIFIEIMGGLAPADEKRITDDRIDDIGQKTGAIEDEEVTLEEQKRITRRIDLPLVKMTGLAYCILLMDRTNLSMAAVG